MRGRTTAECATETIATASHTKDITTELETVLKINTFYSVIIYHRIPKITTVVTFAFGNVWITLLLGSLLPGESLHSGGRYFRGVVTFGSLLLSGVVTFRRLFISGGRYFRRCVTFGGSLLSRGSLLSEYHYLRTVVNFGRGSLLSENRYLRDGC